MTFFYYKIIKTSQKIGHEVAVVFALWTLLNSFEDDEVAVAVLIELQNGCLVVHSIAIVRGGPKGDQLFVEPIDVPFLHKLMCPDDEVDFVEEIELIDHFVSEYPPSSSGIASPRFYVLGIRPHEISQWSFVRYFLFPVEQSHLIDGGQVGGESAVEAEDVAVDDGSQRQVVERLIEVFPAVGVAVFFIDFVQEAVHHCYVSAFVVAAEEVDAVGVLDFEAEEQRYRFDGVVAAVYEIADHDEFALGHSSAFCEQVFDIVELSVDISGQVDWRFDADDVGLLREYWFDHVAEGTDGWFGDGFAVEGWLVPLLDAHIQLL